MGQVAKGQGPSQVGGLHVPVLYEPVAIRRRVTIVLQSFSLGRLSRFFSSVSQLVTQSLEVDHDSPETVHLCVLFLHEIEEVSIWLA